ncbi:hypothetical protein B0H10DRAFT_2194009 [Mycena sp. CBHHK59/15]|nr:hypothetical protein B0H10DRAFT_2194009 [Mycena sp. CBHHK59/15]
MSLTCANIAVAVDEHMRVYHSQEFQQADDDLAEEILGDEYITLQETLASVRAAGLPPVQLPSEASKPFGRGPSTAFETLDFKALVHQRRQHQTRQAAKCARTKHTSEDSPAVAEESTRRQILRKFHELLKEDQARGVGTAVEREARWRTEPKTAFPAVVGPLREMLPTPLPPRLPLLPGPRHGVQNYSRTQKSTLGIWQRYQTRATYYPGS